MRHDHRRPRRELLSLAAPPKVYYRHGYVGVGSLPHLTAFDELPTVSSASAFRPARHGAVR